MGMTNYGYGKTLSALKKAGDATYLTFIKSQPPTSFDKLLTLDKLTPKKIKSTSDYTDVVSEAVSKGFDAFLKKKPKRYGSKEGLEFPKVLERFASSISDQQKRKIAANLATLLDKFYPYARKQLLQATSGWVEKEEDALNIISKNYRILNDETIELLVSKVEKGYEHDTIKAISKKGMAFKAKRFNGIDINADPKAKKELINNVAMTPSLMGKINHKLHLTFEDLKGIPPARRFDFVRTLYEPILKHYTGYSSKPRRYSYYTRRNKIYQGSPQKIACSIINSGFGDKNSVWASKLSVDSLSVEEMEELLFAVVIKKNDEVAKWMDAYKEYSNKKQDVKKLLEGVINWL